MPARNTCAISLPETGRFLDGVREIVFVPYAAVTFSYADYEKKVQARFAELGIRVRSVHRAKDPAALVRGAEAICVGGGNTFALAKKMQQQGLMTAILRKIKAGTPYVGWSAGSNVCCPTICDNKRHAHRGTGVVQSHRSGQIPDQPPLPRRQPRGARRGDPRTAHPGVYRGQSAPLGGRTCAKAALLRCEERETGADRPTARCGCSAKESKPSRSNRAATCLFYYK